MPDTRKYAPKKVVMMTDVAAGEVNKSAPRTSTAMPSMRMSHHGTGDLV
jgi:hypothetical protein